MRWKPPGESQLQVETITVDVSAATAITNRKLKFDFVAAYRFSPHDSGPRPEFAIVLKHSYTVS